MGNEIYSSIPVVWTCPNTIIVQHITLINLLVFQTKIYPFYFQDRFQSMVRCPNTYYITVVEDVTTGQIVGSASLVLEQKFIHKCALVSDTLYIGWYISNINSKTAVVR